MADPYRPGLSYAAQRGAAPSTTTVARPTPRPTTAPKLSTAAGRSYAAQRQAGAVAAASPFGPAVGGDTGPSKPKGDSSLWNNLISTPLRTVAALGPGLVHLGVEAGKTAAQDAWTVGSTLSPAVHAVRTLTGTEPDDATQLRHFAAATNLPYQIAGAVAPAISEVTGKDLPGFTQAHQDLADVAPVTSQFSESAGRTAGRVTHPSRYGEAWSQGQIFPAAVEDVANLSMLAGAAGSAFSDPVRPLPPVAIPEEAAAAKPWESYLGQPSVAPGEAAAVEPATSSVLRPGIAEGPPMPTSPVGLAPGSRIGPLLHEISTGGEKLAGGVAKPWELGLKGIGKGIGALGYGSPGEIIEGAAKSLTSARDPNAPRASPLMRAVARQAFKITPEGADLRQIVGKGRAEAFDRLHEAAEASNLARKIDATPEETMAAVLIADQRLGPLRDLYAEGDPQVFNRTVNDIFAEVPEYSRPTPGSVKLALEAEAQMNGTPLPETIGGPTAEQMDRIGQVYDAIGNVAARAQKAALGAEGWAGANVQGLNPEQLGTEPLSAAADKLRAPLEAKREALTPKWNAAAQRATREQRVADAHTAAFAEIRPSSTPNAMFARGKAAGRLIAEEARAKTAARAAQSSLTQVTNDYVAAVERGDANVNTLGANVDMLTAKVNDALGEVDRAEREVQARKGLRTASGKLETVGAPALSETPSVAQAAKVGETRAALKETGGQLGEEIRRQIADATGDSKPRFPVKGKAKPGEWDFLQQLGTAERKRLSREGWFASSKNASASPIDVWAEAINNRLGTNMSVDEAAEWYLDGIRNVWDLESGKHPEVYNAVSERMGLHPDQVRRIDTGGMEGVNEATAQMVNQVPEIRESFKALSPEDQQWFRQTYETLADPANRSTEADYGELIQMAFPQLAERGGALEQLTGRVDMQQLAEYVARLYTAGTRKPTAAVDRGIGAAEERVRGARRLATVAKRALGKGETAVRNAAAAAYGPAPRSVSAALDRGEQRATLAEEAASRATERRTTGEEMLRPTTPPTPLGKNPTAEEVAQFQRESQATRQPESRALSTAQQLGRINERARAANAVERSTRRALDHVNDDIANIPEKLREAFPDRQAKLNERFIGNARSAARAIERAGTAAPGISGELNKAIDEIIAEHGETPGARLVMPRVIREVFDSVEGMPDDVRTKLDKQLTAWEDARAAMMNKVGDIQFQGSPAPFRGPMTTARLGFKSLMTQADELAARGDHAGAQILRGYAEDIPSTVEAMDKAGIKPTFLTGGEAPSVAKPSTNMSLTEKKLAAQYKRGPGYGAAALDDVTRRQMQQVKAIVDNKTKQQIKLRFGAKADSFVEDASTMTPEELDRAVRAHGYVPLKGDVVAHDTLVVPEHVAREVARYDKVMDDSLLYRLLSRTNSGFKTGVLALSPRWHMGNIAGNAMMAMTYGGVSPAELVKQLNNIRKEGGGFKELYKQGGAVEGRPASLLNQGITRGEHDLMQASRGPSPKAPGLVGRLAEHSYRANEFVDSMMRTAVYDAKLGKGIPSEAAVRQTLNAMGDFGRMSGFERNWVRQTLPFYAWMRHQTQAILRLPIEHPARAVWMAHLANMYTDPTMTPDELRLLGLRVPTPWGGINLSTINPFADPTRMPLIDPTAWGQALSPVIKAPFAVGGLDLSHQPMGQFSRPGRKTGLLNPGELAYYASQQVPFLNTAVQVARDPSIARYKTGEAIPSQAGIPTGKTRLTSTLQGLGIPFPDRSVTREKLDAQIKAGG